MKIRTIVFCKWCGYNASREAQKLTEVCNKKPKQSDVAQQLRRMMKGLHPDRNALEWPGGLSTKGVHHPINLDGVLFRGSVYPVDANKLKHHPPTKAKT